MCGGGGAVSQWSPPGLALQSDCLGTLHLPPLPPPSPLLLQSEYLGTTYSLPRIDNYAIINCVSEEKEQQKKDHRLGTAAAATANGQQDWLLSQRQQFMAAAEAEGSRGGKLKLASLSGLGGSGTHDSTLAPNNQAKRKQRA